MDYEKLHKDTITKLQEMVNSGKITVETACGICADFVPESEDERIRKSIIGFLITISSLKDGKTVSNEDFDSKAILEWVSWLEKQGNLMKALQISNARIGELIEKNYYLKEQLEKQGKNNMGISEATKQKLEDNLNKALEKETSESCNEFLDEQGEQKSIIEMKSAEESLDIDSETYSKIVDECVYGEQNPAWSEEDREMSRIIGNAITTDYASTYLESEGIQVIDAHVWLEELKERVQPHSTWNPSDEQMLAINTAINVVGKGTINGKYLIELQEQLKKLMDEDV